MTQMDLKSRILGAVNSAITYIVLLSIQNIFGKQEEDFAFKWTKIPVGYIGASRSKIAVKCGESVRKRIPNHNHVIKTVLLEKIQ